MSSSSSSSSDESFLEEFLQDFLAEELILNQLEDRIIAGIEARTQALIGTSRRRRRGGRTYNESGGGEGHQPPQKQRPTNRNSCSKSTSSPPHKNPRLLRSPHRHNTSASTPTTNLASPAPPPPQTPTSPSMRLFVLSGQSNMAGRGGVHHRRWDGVIPAECAPDPSILRLSAGLSWEEACDPLHADIDKAKTCGVGPGMPFARAVRPRLPPGSGIGLVPCAVGGTAIREWERGAILYEQMVRRARAAAWCGELEAVLWYQGESDADSDHAAAAYRGNIERLITDLRADLGLPQLPFIQVAIASGNKRNIEKVRNAQLSIDLPNVVTVDAMGLALNEDNLHLTTESQVQLGEMLAQAYIQNFLTSAC